GSFRRYAARPRRAGHRARLHSMRRVQVPHRPERAFSRVRRRARHPVLVVRAAGRVQAHGRRGLRRVHRRLLHQVLAAQQREVFTKEKLDESVFLGNRLQVSYAPQFESILDTKEKLEVRRNEVLGRIRSSVGSRSERLTQYSPWQGSSSGNLHHHMSPNKRLLFHMLSFLSALYLVLRCTNDN
uniref:Uncharacterized protein n=1 Tax=Aegilops tauschii subsp. strangulata TaxID=200361 RepID=A0A453ASN3_AEGTS